MRPRLHPVLGGVAMAACVLAWLGWWAAKGDSLPHAATVVPAVRPTLPVSAVTESSHAGAVASVPVHAERPPMRASAGTAAAPITVVAPQKLLVGEASDLVVSVGRNVGIGEIAFTVQVDPNVLQLRAGSDGSWAAGSGNPARFTAEITGTEDRMRVRSAVDGPRAGQAGGSVALIEFQAVAPGSTALMVSDVSVKDREGRAVAFVLSSSSLPVTVESLPPPTP